jgi:hypothetical protein
MHPESKNRIYLKVWKHKECATYFIFFFMKMRWNKQVHEVKWTNFIWLASGDFLIPIYDPFNPHVLYLVEAGNPFWVTNKTSSHSHLLTSKENWQILLKVFQPNLALNLSNVLSFMHSIVDLFYLIFDLRIWI